MTGILGEDKVPVGLVRSIMAADRIWKKAKPITVCIQRKLDGILGDSRAKIAKTLKECNNTARTKERPSHGIITKADVSAR